MKTETVNPIEQISNLLRRHGYGTEGQSLVVDHISYDKTVNKDYDYQIIREAAHDGTFLFTLSVIEKAILPLVNKTTFCSKTISEEEINNLKDIKYIIGDMTLETEYDYFEMGNHRRMKGRHDTVYIPVRCEYIFK